MLKPNPDVMKFAVERSGRSYASLQDKWPKFDQWLEGTAFPTLKQIQEFAKMVFVPVADLFNDNVPNYDLQIPDYRTVGNASVAPSPELYDTIMMMQWRQDWMREYFKENELDPIPLVGSNVGISHSEYLQVADSIRDLLGLQRDWAASIRSASDAFRFLRKNGRRHAHQCSSYRSCGQ